MFYLINMHGRMGNQCILKANALKKDSIYFSLIAGRTFLYCI